MRIFAAIRKAITTLVLLIGIPILLLAIGGSPLPARVPSIAQVQAWLNDPLDSAYVPTAARTIAWLLWAMIAALVLTVLTASARRWRWARLTAYLPGPVQSLTATLLGAATVTTAAAALPAQAAPPVASVSADEQISATADALDQHHDRGSGAGREATPDDARTTGNGRTVTVHRGDTLWDIAAEHLGDAGRWPEIYHLNADHYDEHGQMRGGDHIERGWVLSLPDAPRTTPDARPAPPRPQTPPTTDPGEQPPNSTNPSPAGPGSTTNPAPDKPTPPATADRPATPSTALTPSSPASDTETPDQRNHGRSAPAGLSLASGSWLDLGLAAAIVAAIALVWRRRRRRYTRRSLSPDLPTDDPDLTPMPPVVREIQRRLRNNDPGPGNAGHTATSIAPITTTHVFSRRNRDPEDQHFSTQESTEPDISAAFTASDTGPQDRPPPQVTTPPNDRPVVPASTNPAADGWPACGLGLTGLGAPSAARGFLAAALADSDPHAPPGRVVLPASTAVPLLGVAADSLPSSPRLIVVDDLPEALGLLEQQILERSRLLAAHEVDTIAALRTADPYEEPCPAILLLADATNSGHEHARIAALLTEGQRLDIHGVVLGTWPAGNTITVDTDGSTTAENNESNGWYPAGAGRLAVMAPAEALAVITTLAEAHTGLSPSQATTEPQPQQTADTPSEATAGGPPTNEANRVLTALANLGAATAATIATHLDLSYATATAKLIRGEYDGHAQTVRTETGQTLWRLTETGQTAIGTAEPTAATEPADTTAQVGRRISAPAPGPVDIPVGQRTVVDTALRWPDSQTTFTSEQASISNDADTKAPGRVAVTVLGEAGIIANNLDRNPRKKALELLVYLAVHDGSATAEAILDDLLPDAPVSKASERLYTYVSDLRAVMRRIGGPATYLTHPNRRYALNPEAVDIDLWRMRTAIREAHQSTDSHQRVELLQRVVDLYRGPLAEGYEYEWIEPYREAIRQQALDAHLALADALTENPPAQIRVLEAAIAHSPYSEELYLQAMRVHAALGHSDAVRATRRALDGALADIDTEPSDDTIAVADDLIADLQRRGRHSEDENVRYTPFRS